MAKSKQKTPDKAELAGFIEIPPLIRAVFWCSFKAKGDMETFETKLSKLENIKWTIDDDYIDDKDVQVLWGSTPGKRVALQLSPQGDKWQLEATFREMGTLWGSNQAEWNRFKSILLPVLDAKDISEETE